MINIIAIISIIILIGMAIMSVSLIYMLAILFFSSLLIFIIRLLRESMSVFDSFIQSFSFMATVIVFIFIFKTLRNYSSENRD